MMIDDLFDDAARTPMARSSNDYHILPPSEKQLGFATAISHRTGVPLPEMAMSDRTALSAWIEQHRNSKPTRNYDNYPSSKQVRFAEVIARKKRREVPRECFRDKTLMSHWISANK